MVSEMPSDSGSAWSPPASNSERRLSNSSDGSACSGYSKTVSFYITKFLLYLSIKDNFLIQNCSTETKQEFK